jgi:aminoglycoside phosphotransferase (APT) family kinase protein
MEPFAAVLAILQLSQVPYEATRLRGDTNRHGQAGSGPSELPVIGAPLHGSFNILFPIDFPDGARWLVKVPADGTAEEWDSLSADALTSEAMTMRLIRQHTSIPVPEVYGFSATHDNPLKCPHIFLSFIPGISLQDLWFSRDVSETNRHLYRTRILEQIAAAMTQLGQFSFRLGGRILFKDGLPTGIGPCRESYDDEGFEAGPFKNSREFYTCVMDRYPSDSLDRDPRTLAVLIGQEKLLRLFIDCITQLVAEDDTFVLTHPDFGLQNFIVSPEGDLVGVIDWEDVTVWPKSLGNMRYPSWLTRDWDPVMYGYEDGELLPNVEREDSPATLALYREVYRKALDRISKVHGFETSVTLITENIAIASKNRGFRYGILKKIVQEIAAIVELPADIGVYDICLELGGDKLEAELQDALCSGFTMLLRHESL